MNVFLSYSSRDRDFVRRLANDLERAGYTVWRDEHGLAVGEDLARIDDAVASADAIVIVLSTASTGSRWVEYEVSRARSLRLRMLPVLLENTGLDTKDASDYSHADFRRHQDYRQSLQRLIAALDDTEFTGRFVTAKEAVARVQDRYGPSGALFGLSQQGVASVYWHANRRDWEWADVANGTSRVWFVEYVDTRERLIKPFAVIDGVANVLPVLRLTGGRFESDGVQTAVVYGCAVNPEAEEIVDAAHIGTPIRRYSRFLPIPLTAQFVDSPAAVEVASESAYRSGRVLPSDLVILTTLECDKRNHQLPTWRSRSSIRLCLPACSP